MFLLLCIIIGLYYVYGLYMTTGIMNDIKKVAQKEMTAEKGTPYARFSHSKENFYTCDIKRYFTYCWFGKGEIFITCVDVSVLEDGTYISTRDWIRIVIEKTNGEWEAVELISSP